MRFALVAVAVLVTLFAAGAQAGEERYDYDGLGRLVRVIDEQGRVTEYVYDAAGNILRVIVSGAGSAQPPVVTASSLTSIRRGETKTVEITGTGLTGAHVSTPDPGLDISGLQVGATQITFSLTATAAALLGAQVITLSSAAGSTSVQVTVNPVLPRLGMSPQPIAVPPTGAARPFFLTLSSPDNIAHVVTLQAVNPARATVSPLSVTFAPGQTERIVTVTGHSAGNTAIELSSPLLATTSVPVFVTADFTGITTSFTAPLGVVVTPAPAPTSTTFTPIAAPLVGVARGAYIDRIEPNHFEIGSGPVSMVVHGNELGGVSAAALVPPEGVTLGAISIAPDGRSLTIAVTVAADAPVTTRRLVLSGAQQPYRPARPDGDRLLITRAPPVVESVSPNFALGGATALSLTVRGRNFHLVQAVTFAPSADIAVSSTPSVSADGTTITVPISLALNATPGPRVLRVVTPAGISTDVASPLNTLIIASETVNQVSGLSAPLVGVVVEGAATPVSQALSAFANHLGVVMPPAVTAMAPQVGIIGQTVTLTLSGAGLGGVTSVQAVPPEGLTIGSPVVSPDGATVSVQVSIALTAPQTLRTIKVLAGGASIQFAGSPLFRVSAPLPQFDAIAPIVLQRGATGVTLTVTGRNLQNASALRVEPSADLTVSPVSANANGTQASATISAAAGAATGPRAVIVATPAGESSAALTPANTLTVVNTIISNTTPIAAPHVGVVLEGVGTPVSTSFGPFAAPLVGVVVDPGPIQQGVSRFVSGFLGVVRGAYSNGVQVPPLTPNASATLTISGAGLADVTAVQIVPPANATVGALSVMPDGTRVTAPLTLSGAAPGPRTVVVLRGTERVFFAPAETDVIRIGVAAPGIDSISPILNSRGQTFTMVIRGQNFQDLTAITATPGSGIAIDGLPSVNAAGTEISVRVSIAADAPLGSSVFRVFTAGGATLEEAVPANTFTVLE